MKARLFTLLLLLATSYTNISAQYKNGAWGINEIPGQNTTAPMVLFNRPTMNEDTAFVKNAIRNKNKELPIFQIYKEIIITISETNSLLPHQGDISVAALQLFLCLVFSTSAKINIQVLPKKCKLDLLKLFE